MADMTEPELGHKTEVIESIEGFAEEQLELLLPVEKSWQPSDFMPDLGSPGWQEEIAQLQMAARELPDDVLVTLVGDMVTEEALPSYQTMLNRMEGVQDETGNSARPWARWSRGWTAEENRHGDLLNRFLFLIGRVDMRSIEVTVHNLIKSGFNPDAGNDPYKGFIYTSFQERATKISHSNVGALARNAGNQLLTRICQVIAGDEARHEEAYKRFMDRIFEIDPRNSIVAFKEMMKKTITMPAALMDDGGEQNLFERFSAVAQRIGVYTAHDYADIIDHLVERWKVPSLSGLFGEAAEAQDYLSSLAERYRKLARRIEHKVVRHPPTPFAWIHNHAA